MHILLSGALLFRIYRGAKKQNKAYFGVSMKIVIWKSPKYLSRLLSKLFGVEEKEKK